MGKTQVSPSLLLQSTFMIVPQQTQHVALHTDSTGTVTASLDAGQAVPTLASGTETAAADVPAAELTGEGTEPAPPTPPKDPSTQSGASAVVAETDSEPDSASEQPATQPPEATAVTIATTVQAAAFKVMPFRVACALCVALVAASEPWDAPVPIPHVYCVMCANITLILLSALMLAKSPRTCKAILQQINIRGASGASKDWYYDLVAGVTRAPAWALKVAVALAWASYIDSGTYIAAAVLLHVLRAAPGGLSDSSISSATADVGLDKPDLHSEL